LNKGQGHIGDLLLDVTKILKEIAKLKKHLSLHASYHISDLVTCRTASAELIKGMPNASNRLIRVRLCALY
jgi:hypothetical protein